MKTIQIIFLLIFLTSCNNKGLHKIEQSVLDDILTHLVVNSCNNSDEPEPSLDIDNPIVLKYKSEKHIAIYDSIINPNFKINFSNIHFPENYHIKTHSQLKKNIHSKENAILLENIDCEIIIHKIIIEDSNIKGYIEYSIGCGNLCGNGYLAHLNFINGHWNIISEQLLWVS